MAFDLNSYLSDEQALINAEIDRMLPDSDGISRIVEAMRYSLLADGKRVRPILCIAAFRLVGGKTKDILPVACALEMIHTYSLIHDDLPAMDNDHLRRGKPTCHVMFDEATALLAGDALLTLAFETLSAPTLAVNRTAQWLEVIQTISKAAGFRGMIEGQMRDMHAEGSQLTLDALEVLHHLKTGALIRASVLAGAVVGGGCAEQIKNLEIYAQNLGLAFQITDDILNIEGDPHLMGKAAGTDALRCKNTYPVIMGLDEAKQYARTIIDRALKALENFDNRAQPLREIAQYILTRKR